MVFEGMNYSPKRLSSLKKFFHGGSFYSLFTHLYTIKKATSIIFLYIYYNKMLTKIHIDFFFTATYPIHQITNNQNKFFILCNISSIIKMLKRNRWTLYLYALIKQSWYESIYIDFFCRKTYPNHQKYKQITEGPPPPTQKKSIHLKR